MPIFSPPLAPRVARWPSGCSGLDPPDAAPANSSRPADPRAGGDHAPPQALREAAAVGAVLVGDEQARRLQAAARPSVQARVRSARPAARVEARRRAGAAEEALDLVHPGARARQTAACRRTDEQQRQAHAAASEKSAVPPSHDVARLADVDERAGQRRCDTRTERSVPRRRPSRTRSRACPRAGLRRFGQAAGESARQVAVHRAPNIDIASTTKRARTRRAPMDSVSAAAKPFTGEPRGTRPARCRRAPCRANSSTRARSRACATRRCRGRLMHRRQDRQHRQHAWRQRQQHTGEQEHADDAPEAGPGDRASVEGRAISCRRQLALVATVRRRGWGSALAPRPGSASSCAAVSVRHRAVARETAQAPHRPALGRRIPQAPCRRSPGS